MVATAASDAGTARAAGYAGRRATGIAIAIAAGVTPTVTAAVIIMVFAGIIADAAITEGRGPASISASDGGGHGRPAAHAPGANG